MKSAVDRPVMIVGGLRDPRLIQQTLDDGHADMISLCRPFIREPHLLLRWKRGDLTPAACISCGLCHKKMREGPLRCRQDSPSHTACTPSARAGREVSFLWHRALLRAVRIPPDRCGGAPEPLPPSSRRARREG